MLGGLSERLRYRDPVETFKTMRAMGLTKKVIVPGLPLQKWQIVDYFDQLREVIHHYLNDYSRENGRGSSREL